MEKIKDLLFELIVSSTNSLDEKQPDHNSIILELTKLTNQDFGQDVEQWVAWYLSKHADDTAFIQGAYGIFQARKKYSKDSS